MWRALIAVLPIVLMMLGYNWLSSMRQPGQPDVFSVLGSSQGQGRAAATFPRYSSAVSQVRFEPELDDPAGADNACGAKGNPGSVLEDCTRAIELDAANAGLYSARGIAYYSRSAYDLAVADFTRAIELKSGVAAMYAWRGAAQRGSGAAGLAVADLTKAIELDPKYVAAYIWRGGVHYGRGELNPALDDFTTAIKLDGSRADAFCGRGFTVGDLGVREQAVADLETCLRLNPGITARVSIEQLIGELKGR